MDRIVDGMLETALYVDDPARSARFYIRYCGLAPLVEDERLVALDCGRRSVLLLFRRGSTREPVSTGGGTIPPHDGSGSIHIAFAVSEQALVELERRFAEHGLDVEGRTTWPRGGTSIYVRDPDGHLVEFATPGLWATY